MKRRLCVLVCGSLLIAGCGQSADQAPHKSVATAANPPKKHSYCFFQDDEMKGWKTSRDPHGDISVEGEAHVKDPRYKAAFGAAEIGPHKAIVQPTLSQNDTGYATPDNWWHLGLIVPNTASLTEVEVHCGDKVVADLKVPLKS